MQMRNCDVVATPPGDRIIAKQHGRKNKMAVSIEKSRDMQMRNCDVISHLTALDPSEPSIRLTRSAPGDNITAKKKCLGGDNRDDTLRPLATVSPQKGAIYVNLCKFIVAPSGDNIIAKQCLRGDNRG